MAQSNSAVKAVVWSIVGGTVTLKCHRRNDLVANKSVCPSDIRVGEQVFVSFNYDRNSVRTVDREIPSDKGIADPEEHFEDCDGEECFADYMDADDFVM